MGLFINKGNAGFASVCGSGFVDKSMLIDKVNRALLTESRFMCVTRARRFGKSVAVKMLNAYYDKSCDSTTLFKDLKISETSCYRQHLNQYPVIYLDMTDFLTKYGNDTDLVEKIKQDIVRELLSLYGDALLGDGDDLMDLLVRIVSQTREPFICLIDEWDALCREGNELLMDAYVDLLRRLFKGSNSESVFACVYMTGILPIKRYNTQSALNNFEEYTMLSPADLAPYFGFTETEVSRLCQSSRLDIAEMKRWYDGYEVGDEKAIYNPYAVIRALKRGRFENYWTSTNTFEALKQYLTMNFEGLKDDVIRLLSDVPVAVNHLKFSNDMHRIGSKDDVLTLLCHLGYLSYNWESGNARIPNFEVRNEFEMAIADTHWTEVQKALGMSDHLLECVLAGDAEEVAQCVEKVHQENISVLKYNDENALSCVLTLAFYTARKMYYMLREFPAGKGFADIVMMPYRDADAPAIVLELKYNDSADSAIAQIKGKNYAGALSHYAGEIILVGINYDKKSKIHICKLEKYSFVGRPGSTESNTKGNTKSNTNERPLIVLTDQQQRVVDFCREQPHSAMEIFRHLSISKQAKHYKLYIDYLVQNGLLIDVTPESKREKRYLSK